jgi:predicted RNA-binding protein associated with RNAse of E/G family
MKLSVKTLGRPDWTRITRRKDAFARVDRPGFSGEAYLIRIDELTAPLRKTYDDGSSVTIVDVGYRWLQLAPESGRWWLTVMFDSSLSVVQYYFDITAGSNLLGGADSFFTDLFLDVVMMPDGKIIVLDEDELEQALEEHIIDPVTFDIVKKDAAALIADLEGNAPALEKLCREILMELIEKL